MVHARGVFNARRGIAFNGMVVPAPYPRGNRQRGGQQRLESQIYIKTNNYSFLFPHARGTTATDCCEM
jgi:hypothetical protein